MFNKKIKVLHVFASLNIGGAETRTIELLKKLDQTKFDFVFLVHDDQIGFYEDELIELGLKVYHLIKPRPFNFLNFIWDLNNFFKENSFDILHNHLTSYGVFHHYFAFRYNIKMRISHSRSNRFGTGIFKNLLKFIMSIGIRYLSTHRLAVTFEAGKLIYGRKNFTVFRNSIDKTIYTKNKSFRISFRDKYNFKGDNIVIGHIGRFTSEKNHVFIIKLFRNLLKYNSNYRLVLVGKGKLREFIVKETKKMRIFEFITFIEKVDNSVEVLNGIDILVFPSLYEGMPGVLLEAQAIGCPVVFSSRITKDATVSYMSYRLPLKQLDWIKTIELVCKGNYSSIVTINPIVNLQDQAEYLSNLYHNGVN